MNRQEYETLKSMGLLWEIYPDAPQTFEEIDNTTIHMDPVNPTPPSAQAMAEEIIDHLFPGGFCADEENSAVGHKGEAEEEIKALITRHFSSLLRERDELREAQMQALGLCDDDHTIIADEIRRIRDEGRSHFHEVTKLQASLARVEGERTTPNASLEGKAAIFLRETGMVAPFKDSRDGAFSQEEREGAWTEWHKKYRASLESENMHGLHEVVRLRAEIATLRAELAAKGEVIEQVHRAVKQLLVVYILSPDTRKILEIVKGSLLSALSARAGQKGGGK